MEISEKNRLHKIPKAENGRSVRRHRALYRKAQKWIEGFESGKRWMNKCMHALPEFIIAAYFRELHEELGSTYVLTLENMLIFTISCTILRGSPLIRSVAKDILERD